RLHSPQHLDALLHSLHLSKPAHRVINRSDSNSSCAFWPFWNVSDSLTAIRGCKRVPGLRSEAANPLRLALAWEGMLSMKPLVSILIPAYKAERWIAETIRSAIGKTYARKEIIVVDDGSPDQTAAVARQFASKEVTVASTDNQGAVAARNYAFSLCQGDYIQWLDADDILAPDKIERQVAAMKAGESRKILLSSSWAPFYYRTHKARFICTALCQDLNPADWLIHKMSGNLHMQTATWLTSRELCEAAGKWNSQMLSDDDGEYFCRVLLKSEGTRFVPGTGVFYRTVTTDRLSHIGNSEKKRDAMFLSMQLHVQYLRSLEE